MNNWPNMLFILIPWWYWISVQGIREIKSDFIFSKDWIKSYSRMRICCIVKFLAPTGPDTNSSQRVPVLGLIDVGTLILRLEMLQFLFSRLKSYVKHFMLRFIFTKKILFFSRILTLARLKFSNEWSCKLNAFFSKINRIL